MIFGNIKNLNEYNYLPSDIKRCFEYAASNDLLNYEKGSHTIDGDNLFVNIVEYEFVEKDDFLPLEGEKNGHVILEKGDFLICYPNDAHRTAVKIEDSQKIKKAIFKIIIEK